MSDITQTSARIAAPHIDYDFGTESGFCFGSFRLLPVQRLLLDGDKPLRLGSRALDILIALIRRPGELVSKEDIMAQVWPNTFVDPANLTVHIAALRRALRDGRDGNRFLINIPGRGYRFVAPITTREELALCPADDPVVEHPHNLPASVTRLIGREDIVAGLSAQFARDRFLTVVGPGGIGKTSVALTVAQALVSNYRNGVCLIDLVSGGHSCVVSTALAAALGLETGAETPLPQLISAISDKQMLLVLDNCEHVITAAAGLAAAVLTGAPGVHILATSREPLHTEGERVYRLSPLKTPPSTIVISAEEAMRFPAVQLFVERAAAALGEYALSDADARVVADICLKLDGLPLAIEIAAGRINCFGIRGLAARLDDPLCTLIGGSRTAHPRQQALRAALDWSYNLLSEDEQSALRRLAIFADYFTLQAAGAVISDSDRSSDLITHRVTELVTKSLIAVEIDDAEPRLRLATTTRAYALAKLIESGELDAVARCHDKYCRNAMSRRASPRMSGGSRAMKASASVLFGSRQGAASGRPA